MPTIEMSGNGGEMRVTLGEVSRNVLALRGDFTDWRKEHERGHETNGRWMVTTVLAIGGLIIAVIAAAKPG